MPLPAKPKTFGLHDCRDMLGKLEWEIDRLKNTPAADPDALCFIAFNAAVTAWHLAEWVWSDMDDEQRAAVPASDLAEFKKHVLERSRQVHICRQIATASKHVTIELREDPTLETRVSWTTTDALVRRPRFVAKIIDRGRTAPGDTGVQFVTVKAKGKFSVPDIVWDLAKFDEAQASIAAFTAGLEALRDSLSHAALLRALAKQPAWSLGGLFGLGALATALPKGGILTEPPFVREKDASKPGGDG